MHYDVTLHLFEFSFVDRFLSTVEVTKKLNKVPQYAKDLKRLEFVQKTLPLVLRLFE